MRWIFFYSCIIVSVLFASALAQKKTQDVTLYRGDKTTLTFSVKGDLTGLKLYFTVKQARVDSLLRKIERRNLLAGGDSAQIYAAYTSPNTTLFVTIRKIDTWDLPSGKYVYDVESVNPADSMDMQTYLTGNFNIKSDVRTPWDGTNLPDSGRTWFVLGEGNTNQDFAIYDAVLGHWIPISKDSVVELLAIEAGASVWGGISGDLNSQTDLQNALNAKLSTAALIDSDFVKKSETTNWDKDASNDLTTSTTFGGDVSGSYNSIAIADDSHNHTISNVDGLQTAIDGKASSSHTHPEIESMIKARTSIVQILIPTVDDTLFLNRYDGAAIIDSVWFKSDDSATVQIRFGADGSGTNLFSSAELITIEKTISSFNDNTIPANNEAYLYFTALGDAVTSFRFKVYWGD